MVIMGFPLTLISIVIIKPKRGVGSHIEKGWDSSGPTASLRTRFGSHIEKSWVPPSPIWVPDLGPSIEKSSEPPRVPPSTYRDTCKAGGFEGAILGLENTHASGFNITCLHSIIRMQSAYMPCLGEGQILQYRASRSKLRASF